jgi:hypothetical protein
MKTANSLFLVLILTSCSSLPAILTTAVTVEKEVVSETEMVLELEALSATEK